MAHRIAYVLQDIPFGPDISISPLHQQSRENIVVSMGISERLYRYMKRFQPKREPYWGGYKGGWWAYNLSTLLSNCESPPVKREIERMVGVLVLVGLVNPDDD